MREGDGVHSTEIEREREGEIKTNKYIAVTEKKRESNKKKCGDDIREPK